MMKNQKSIEKNYNTSIELYTKTLFNLWSDRKSLNNSETYFLKKYLISRDKKVLEAGTGGGIISLEVEKMGFTDISAFDNVPEMIAFAQKHGKDNNSKIKFSVNDAADLKEFNDSGFDYLIYFQQILCFINDKTTFKRALTESYRLTNNGGIVIFSFLDFDSRLINFPLSILSNLFRKYRGEYVSFNYLPWLKVGSHFNWKLFHKNQPLTYWVKKNDIVEELKNTGFMIIEALNENQIEGKTSCLRGMLYVVCKKNINV